MIAAVVLAAGRSSRMGTPKMVLPWGETTVIAHVVNALQAAAVAEVVVVTGGAHELVGNALRETTARVVFNSQFGEFGMLRSFQIGLAAIDPTIQAVLVALGDQPQIETSVVRQVIAAYSPESHPILIPSYQMRRGHPWLVASTLWASLLSMDASSTLRDFLDRNVSQIGYVPVDSPSVLQDMDTPEDYQRHRPGF
jgi:molybdenum cofactor cytidylyltransferase